MITTSEAWKEYAKNNFIYHIKAVLTPSSGSALNLTDEDFMMGSVRFNDSTSDSNTFTIGGVITNTFEGTLNNTEGKFDNFNFDGATISVQVGIKYENGTSEYINRGVYTVDKPSTMGSTIQLTCYDYMDKLNTYYIGKRYKFYTPGDYASADLIDIAFPQTAATMMQYLCDYCHVSWDASSWSLGSFTVNEFEYNESTTCRQVLGWILQCVGGFAKMSPTGTIQCKWYDAKFWSNAIDMDGGVFNPWQTAGNLNGGTMWVAVPTYSGGTMLDGASWEFTQVSRINVGVVDIEITGVRAYTNGTVDEFEFATVGSDGYIIALSDNPLITSSNMQTVATNVYNQCQGLHFRIFDASVWASPNMEAGDSCLIQDYRGKVYPSIVTNMNYTLNGLCDVECNAETPGENSLEIANPQTQTIAGATRAAYDYISAKKLDADTIGFGILQSNDSPPSFYLNLDTGQLNINATSLYENSNAVASESYADGVASTAVSNYDTALNQTAVFNKLTNNGALQGLYMENGQLYINASYLRASGVQSTAYTFTDADLDVLKQIVLGQTLPTYEDAIYDLNGDGKYSLSDLTIIKQLLLNSSTYDLKGSVTINPTDLQRMIVIENDYNNAEVIIGVNAIQTPNLFIRDTPVIDHIVYENQMLTGNNGQLVYLKYTNGMAIADYLVTLSCACTSPYGSMYYVDKTISYPSISSTVDGKTVTSNLFTKAPITNITIIGSTGLFFPSIHSNSASQFSVYIASATRITQTLTLNIHAVGAWK